MSPYVRPYSVQPGDRLAAWSVFLILLSIYTATFTGLPDNPDAEVEFQTTHALAQSGTLALGGTPEARAIIAKEFNVVPGGPGREHERFSWFGVGQAFTGLPFYYAGRALSIAWPEVEQRHAAVALGGVQRSEYFPHLLVGWRNALLGALTAFLLVLTSRRLGMGRRAAWITGLTYGLCTFAWPQARSTLSDVQATFLLFGAFYFLSIAAEHFDRLRSPRTVDLALVGTCLGAAVLTRIAVLPAAFVLAVAALLMLIKGRRRIVRTFEGGSPPLPERPLRRHVALLVPIALCAALFFWTNDLRFGDPLETGYGQAFASGTFFSYPLHLGLLGLLVSPGKGLLWMAPGLLLLPWGLRRVDGGRAGRWPKLLAFLALACFVPVALTQTWTGAYTYGPRYLLPFLPFAWMAFGFAVERGTRRVRVIAVVLSVVGLLVQLPAALVDHMTHQDLAVQAARVEWPEPGGADERERDEARFLNIQWDWGFAAPWAHWRILRHRVAGLPEEFPVSEVFMMDSDLVVRPGSERERGFSHLAWVDLSQRLRGAGWPAGLFCLLLLGAGVVVATGALDRTRL